MIAVIADDFTGAAEIGAIGSRFGLNTEVQTEFYPSTGAELIVVDTHTRSCSRENASQVIKNEVEKIKWAKPSFIYKKIDSVLRGPVIAELETMIGVLGKKRALVVAANPSAGRKIRNGHYFIYDSPLHETDFALDPEYPAISSNVLELLGPSKFIPVKPLQIQQVMPPEGILISDATDRKTLGNLASLADNRTVIAGAAEFFSTLLETFGYKTVLARMPDTLLKPSQALFLFGSSCDYSLRTLKHAQSMEIPILNVSPEMILNCEKSPETVQASIEHTVNTLRFSKKMIVAMVPSGGFNFPIFLAHLTHGVLKKICDDGLHVFIEGGSTASTVVRFLEWSRLVPIEELAPGVATLHVFEQEHLQITTKPGSYSWPEGMW